MSQISENSRYLYDVFSRSVKICSISNILEYNFISRMQDIQDIRYYLNKIKNLVEL